MSGQLIRRRFMRRFTGLARYSRLMAWATVGIYLAQILASVALGHLLLTMPLAWWSVLLMVALAVFIGTRLRGLNNIVHECTHSSFCDTRQDNVTIGRFCSAILTGCFRSYKDDHLSHHAHLGDYHNDAEFAVIEKFRLHEAVTWRSALRLFLAPLTGQHLRTYSGVNMSAEDGPLFLWMKITILYAMAFFAMFVPLTALFFVILPWFFIFPTLNFWTDCLDHAGIVGEEDELRASRNVLAPTWVRLLFFPRNDCYHLVHHLFPQVPARHLKKAHEALCDDPIYVSVPAAARSDKASVNGLFT